MNVSNDRAARRVVARGLVAIMPFLFGIAVVVPAVRGTLTTAEVLFGVATFLAFSALAGIVGLPIARARLVREANKSARS
jgi:hypothetical protein